MPGLKQLLVLASAAATCVLTLSPGARTRLTDEWGPAVQRQIEKHVCPVGSFDRG